MADWRKPKRSFSNGNCVEVSSGVQVRDSKNRNGTVLTFSPPAWRTFTRHAMQAPAPEHNDMPDPRQ